MNTVIVTHYYSQYFLTHCWLYFFQQVSLPLLANSLWSVARWPQVGAILTHIYLIKLGQRSRIGDTTDIQIGEVYVKYCFHNEVTSRKSRPNRTSITKIPQFPTSRINKLASKIENHNIKYTRKFIK